MCKHAHEHTCVWMGRPHRHGPPPPPWGLGPPEPQGATAAAAPGPGGRKGLICNINYYLLIHLTSCYTNCCHRTCVSFVKKVTFPRRLTLKETDGSVWLGALICLTNKFSLYIYIILYYIVLYYIISYYIIL